MELAQLTGPELVEPLTATTLGVREQPGRTLTEAIIAWAVDRDRCSSWTTASTCSTRWPTWPPRCCGLPGLRILATSQCSG